MVLELVRPVHGLSQTNQCTCLAGELGCLEGESPSPKQGEYTAHTPAGVELGGG